MIVTDEKKLFPRFSGEGLDRVNLSHVVEIEEFVLVEDDSIEGNDPCHQFIPTSLIVDRDVDIEKRVDKRLKKKYKKELRKKRQSLEKDNSFYLSREKVTKKKRKESDWFLGAVSVSATATELVVENFVLA